MSDPATQIAHDDQPAPQTPSKRISPGVAGGIFIVLLMIGFAISNWVTRTGPSLVWKYDLNQSIEAAAAGNRRIFLYLHEKDCPITAELDRNLFTQRYAREILDQMIPCRLEVTASHPTAQRFGFRKDPVSVLLDSSGQPMLAPHVGGFDEREFTTYVRPH